ncbi:GIY-YIG nuclease family protein [Patescibacteria group bacterium]|nr:GIY-YIG nuclease family protein [Patescibacteria group bacterium]
MYYVYVIKSVKYLSRYIGSTEDVAKRVKEHNQRKSRYTKGRVPWHLVYEEEFASRSQAIKRETFLKTGKGRKYLDSRLKK